MSFACLLLSLWCQKGDQPLEAMVTMQRNGSFSSLVRESSRPAAWRYLHTRHLHVEPSRLERSRVSPTDEPFPEYTEYVGLLAHISLHGAATFLARHVTTPVVLAVTALQQLFCVRVVPTTAAHEVAAVTSQ